MTPTQRKVLDYIHEVWAATGRTPTFRKIMAHCGHKSPQTAHSTVHRLIDLGHLRHGLPRARCSYMIAVDRDLSGVTTDALQHELQRREKSA